MFLLLTITDRQQSVPTPANHDKAELGAGKVLKNGSDNIS